MVLGLESTEIHRLVGESEETKLSRTRLNEKLETLQRGLHDIKRFQRHRDGSTVLNADSSQLSAADFHVDEAAPAHVNASAGTGQDSSESPDSDVGDLDWEVPRSPFHLSRLRFQVGGKEGQHDHL